MIKNFDNDEEREGEQGDKQEPFFAKVGKYAAIGLEFPSTVLGGLFLGYILDRYFDSSPWLTAALTLLALVGAFIRLIQVLQRLSSENR